MRTIRGSPLAIFVFIVWGEILLIMDRGGPESGHRSAGLLPRRGNGMGVQGPTHSLRRESICPVVKGALVFVAEAAKKAPLQI